MTVPGLTVRILYEDKIWRWELYDAQCRVIGRSCLAFDSKVDCYLNCAAHGAMCEATLEIIE